MSLRYAMPLFDMYLAVLQYAPRGNLTMTMGIVGSGLVITFKNNVNLGQYGELEQQESITVESITMTHGNISQNAIHMARELGARFTFEFDTKLREAKGTNGEYYGRRG